MDYLSPYKTITYEKVNRVATICLNRPHAHNAYNTIMRDELYQVLEATREDTDVRAVILSGHGTDFCGGADLNEFGTSPSMTIARDIRWERDVWGLFFNLGKPITAAVQGRCIGSGVEMAMLSDICIASSDASFSMPETRLGLIPAAGGTQTLTETLGISKSLILLLSKRCLNAKEALALGLVTKMIPKDRLLEEAIKIARRLSCLDQAAVSALKKALWRGPREPLEQALELEQRLALALLSAKTDKGVYRYDE